MDPATIAAVIAAMALVMNVITNFLGGSWKLGQRLTDMETGLRKAISEAKLEIEVRQEDLRRELGETVAAVRQKIHDVELFAANNYVRRESFYQVKAELSSEIKVLGDRIDARMERFEKKIDHRNAPD